MNDNGGLSKSWDKRWQGSEKSERLTLLGRWMFRAKKSALSKTLSGLEIRSIIDVGCGLGHILEFYYQTGIECTGIDISPHAVAVCKKKGLPAIVQKMEDVERIFDLVSSDGMLEHYLNFEPRAQQLMKLSRRYVLLIQPNHEQLAGKTLAYLSELFRKENVLEYNYRIGDFIEVFSANKFNLIRNIPVFFDVFRILVFEKNTEK